MKKTLILLGVFTAVFLMISSATAVPQVQSENVVKKLDVNKKVLEFLDRVEELELNIKDNKNSDLVTNDLSELLQALLQMIKEFIKIVLMAVSKVFGNIAGILGGILSLLLLPFSVILGILSNLPAVVEGILTGIIVVIASIINGLGCLIIILFGLEE